MLSLYQVTGTRFNMVKREQLTTVKLQSLLQMIEDDGVAPPGEVSSAHVAAIRKATELDYPAKVSEAHRNGQSPP